MKEEAMCKQTSHFQERMAQRFGIFMTDEQVEHYWAKGYPVHRTKRRKLPIAQHRHSVYRIVIIRHCPAMMVRSTRTNQFITIY